MILELNNVKTFYGASQVLFGVTMSIGHGEVVTLMGRNGMGKTTTVRSIMGLTPALEGSITFDGVDIRNRPPHKIAELGVGLVPEGRQIFPNLTVRENLIATSANNAGTDTPWTMDRVIDLFPRLEERRKQEGITLSGGEQQMLSIARALARQIKVLLLDEPYEGLAPLVRDEIWSCLEYNLKQSGQAILVIDKHPEAMARIADRHFVMEKGKIAWSGTSQELLANAEMQHRFLGV